MINITKQLAEALAMEYGEIVDEISPLSNNSADHDVEFARRILSVVGNKLEAALSAQAAPKVPEGERLRRLAVIVQNEPVELIQKSRILALIADQFGGTEGRLAVVAQPEAKAQAVPVAWQVKTEAGVWGQPFTKSALAEEFRREGREVRALVDAAAPQPPAPSEQRTVMFNGLTEAETSATASVAGLKPIATSEPELAYCKYCQGSGESTHMVGRGPDAHDEPCECDKCGGTGVFQAGRVVDVGLLKYRGSGVAHIHARMTAYWSVLDAAWEALKNAGIRPDGNTSVAMAIERLSASSEQRKPLTDEELWELKEKHLWKSYTALEWVEQDDGLPGCYKKVKRGYADFIGFARAIEAAHCIQTTGGDHD